MSTPLEEAVACIKAGNTEKGKQLLADVLKQNPRDENAWLWMTRCVTSTEQKRDCFNRVLKINPQNQYAIEGLRRLNNPVSPKTQSKPKVNQQPVEKKRLGAFGIIVIIGLGFAFIFFCLCPLASMVVPGSNNTPAPTADNGGGSFNAYLMCQQKIEERLVSPATAEFPPMSDISVLPVKDTKATYLARGYVDSQNGFGALIRTHYVCEVSYGGNNRWRLDYLEFEE